MPKTMAKARADIERSLAEPATFKKPDVRANEDVVQEMLKHLDPCCKGQAERERWTTWEIEDGACLKCYRKLMDAGLV